MRIPSEREVPPSAAPEPVAPAFEEEPAELEVTMTAARIRSEERRLEAAEDRRSQRRRRVLFAVAGVLAIGLLAAAAVFVPELNDPRTETISTEAVPPEPASSDPPASGPPDAGADRGGGLDLSALLADAEKFAAGREGEIAFALVDGGSGVRGRAETTQFQSASVVKSMLLAAELRRLDAEGLPLDSETQSLLTSMITISDNDAATAIYSRVGDDGLNAVAQRTGMKDFEVAISWGYAKITAGDMARLFAQLDRILPDRFEKFGKGLLGSVTPEQSWGIPAVAKDWSVRFKGGWIVTDSGQLVSQAAELRRGSRELSMAILTDGQPSMAYGIETVEGITARLLGRK